MELIQEQKDGFWFNTPEILIDKERLIEFFPVEDMSFNEKLNAILRLSIYSGLFLFFYHKKYNILLFPIFVALITLYLYKYNTIQTEEDKKEGFEDNETCQMPTDENPMMNTLLTDVGARKEKKEACIFYDDKEVEKDVKKRLEKGLFKDVNDIYNKGNSQRQFFTMPNTTEYGIKHGDTVKMANWLYNTNEPTCKEDTGYCTNPRTFYNEELRNKPHLILQDE
jgi:hypothetical protein